MDDHQAYSILKIRPGTSKDKISVRYTHFVKLCKLHQRGEKVGISPEEIELMKEAYQHLLYKKIKDDELADLYPRENTGFCYQIYKKLLRPFLIRHKPQIIYTVIMCLLTYLIVFIITYQPVDLRIAILCEPPESFAEYESRSASIEYLENELKALPGIEKPRLEYHPCIRDENRQYFLIDSFPPRKADICIMKEDLYRDFKNRGFAFQKLDKMALTDARQAYDSLVGPVFSDEVMIGKETAFYKSIRNWDGESLSWVAVVLPDSRHRTQTMNFLRSVMSSAE